MTTPSKPTRGVGPVPDAEELKNENLHNFLTQVRKYLLEVQIGRVAALSGSGDGTGGGTPAPAPVPGPPGPPGPPAPAPYIPDLTPPPTPSGVSVFGGVNAVGITTDAPTFLMGHGYARTLVYGVTYPGTGPLPTFSEAVKVHEFVGDVGSFPADFAQQWHIWLKWLTNDGVESVSPSGGANGDIATTAVDVTGLINALSGQIRESELFATLGDRIELIDGPSTLAGSVAARILAEADARGTAITNEATIRQNADDALATTITTLTASTPANAELTPRLFYDFDAGVDGWTATAAAISSTGGLLSFIPTATNPRMNRAFAAPDQFLGALATSVRAKVRRVSGTGTWEGNCYYTTAAHTSTGSFVKTIQAPASPGVWNILEWDMANLTAGGTDWLDNVIEGIRIDLVGSESPASVWEFDWIVVGSPAVSPTLAALQIEQAVRASADAAEALSRETLAVQLRGSYTGNDLNLVSSGFVFTERNARVTADSANAESISIVNARLNSGGDIADSLVSVTTTANAAASDASDAVALAETSASQITQVQSRIGSESGMATAKAWDFLTSADGWVGGGATVAASGGGITWVTTAANPSLSITFPTPDRFLGADRDLIRARIRRSGGTGTWEGRLFYSTTTHGNSGSFTKVIAAPADPDAWNVLEWDMSALTAGGTDWMVSTITGLRLDLVSDAGSTWRIDWIASGSKTTTPISAAVVQEISTRASQTGHLGALWTVRMTVGNIAGGFGLSGTSSPDAGATIDFGVRANRFFIAPPEGVSGVGSILPFIVQTTPTTINGQAVPAGVYIDTAFIRDGTIIGVKIGLATITEAHILGKLSASIISAGSIGVGDYIQSTNFISGTQGWRISGSGGFEIRNTANNRIFHLGASGANPVLQIGSALQILANGTAFFAGTVNAAAGNFTGNVNAATGTIGGCIIDASGVRSSNYVAGSAGWRIHNNGTAEFDAATVRGNVTADTLNAASGTIGTITAGLLRDAANQTRINLNATGSQDFLRAGGGLVRITADGDAYFTKVIASGTRSTNINLIFLEESEYVTREVVFMLDTGANIPWAQLYERTLSCRIGSMTAAYANSAPDGVFIGSVTVNATVSVKTPFFAANFQGPGQNPFGTGNQRPYLRLAFSLDNSENLNLFRITSINWTLDVIG